MLNMDGIWECKSDWAATFVVVFEKELTARVCIDYMELDAETRKDCYPLCDIQSSLDCLHGSTIYTSLDLVPGYYQIDVNKADQHKTAFLISGGGIDCFKRIPFSLNASATFSRIINYIFQKRKKSTFCHTLMILPRILPTFRNMSCIWGSRSLTNEECRTETQPSRCFFGQTQIAVLGHGATKAGVQ